MKYYVIEARDKDGQLDLAEPQPESMFGLVAITGLNDNQMADVIFRHKPNASLQGDSIAKWPTLLDPRWKAREKTW